MKIAARHCLLRRICSQRKLIVMVLLVAVMTTVESASAQTFSVLHNFTGFQDGATPYAGVTIDAAGNLYGTTAAGGNANCDGGCGRSSS